MSQREFAFEFMRTIDESASKDGSVFEYDDSQWHEAGANTIGARFERFHKSNPHVYRELVRLARQAIDAGKERIGMKALWEVARWNLELQTAGDSFKLNNNYTSRYARMIMEQESDLAGIFETRRLG